MYSEYLSLYLKGQDHTLGLKVKKSNVSRLKFRRSWVDFKFIFHLQVGNIFFLLRQCVMRKTKYNILKAKTKYLVKVQVQLKAPSKSSLYLKISNLGIKLLI